MGIIVQGKELWKALFTRTQRRLLGLLYGHPERSYYANEIVRLAGVGTGAVQRELANFVAAGILSVRRMGNQKHFQANPECPFYPELRSMVVKTFGAWSIMRAAARSLPGDVALVLAHGPGVTGAGPAQAPIELLLVASGIQRAEAERTLGEAARQLGRELQLTILRPDRFRSLLDAGDARLRELLAEPRVALAGDLENFDS